MSQDEFDELHAQVEAVAQHDVHLGRVLYSMLTHLGTLAGVAVEPAPVKEEEAAPENAAIGEDYAS